MFGAQNSMFGKALATSRFSPPHAEDEQTIFFSILAGATAAAVARIDATDPTGEAPAAVPLDTPLFAFCAPWCWSATLEAAMHLVGGAPVPWLPSTDGLPSEQAASWLSMLQLRRLRAGQHPDDRGKRVGRSFPFLRPGRPPVEAAGGAARSAGPPAGGAALRVPPAASTTRRRVRGKTSPIVCGWGGPVL